MSFNPWGPNEPASTVLAEEAWLQGALVAAVAYGVLLVLFYQCFYLLLKQTRRSNFKAKVPFLLIVFLIFMLGTFFTGSNFKFTQQAFIEDRNYPGGPNAYENLPSANLGTISYVILQWLCDALLLWRYMMIYKGCIVPAWILMTPPIIVYLGSFVMGVFFLLQLSAASPLVQTDLNWTIPYISISLALNILVTIAIVLRLLVIRHRITSVLGPTHGSQYTSIAAMIVESASLYSLFAVFFLVPFGLNSAISAIPLQTIGLVQGCATLLIVFRVASGKAWSSNTQESLISTHGASHNFPGGIQMNRVVPVTIGSGTAIGSRRTVGSLGIDHKESASSFLAASVNGVTVIKETQTDADANSENLDVDFSRTVYDRV